MTLSENAVNEIAKHFGKIEDPRVEGRCGHKLVDIIGVAVVGVLCGANSWSEIETLSMTVSALNSSLPF